MRQCVCNAFGTGGFGRSIWLSNHDNRICDAHPCSALKAHADQERNPFLLGFAEQAGLPGACVGSHQLILRLWYLLWSKAFSLLVEIPTKMRQSPKMINKMEACLWYSELRDSRRTCQVVPPIEAVWPGQQVWFRWERLAPRPGNLTVRFLPVWLVPSPFWTSFFLC